MQNIKHFKAILAFVFSIALLSCNNQPKNAGDQSASSVSAAFTPFTALVVKHTVADFNQWVPAFNAHDSVRKAYGLSVIGYGRGTDDSNTVVLMLKAADLQKAKDFAALPSLKDAMQKAGVTGAPEMTYVNVIRNDNSKIDQMNRMMVSHHVKDFNAWLKVYDAEGVAKRTEEGFADRAMSRGVEDTNMVYLVFAVNDMAKAKAAIMSDDKKKLMTDAGVDSQPTVFFYKLSFLQE